MPLQPRRGGYYPPATPTTKTWEYNDSTWSDLLTNFNGESITYDEIGNPLTIGEKSLTWTGRQLQSITDGDSEISYTYNGDGLRTSKTVNGTKTEYFYNGSILAGQKTGDDTLVFMYDNNSDIFGVIYNDVEYYYIKNAQNDVIAIADTDGNVLVKYFYDAWGKIILITDGNDNDITNLENDLTLGQGDILTGETNPVLDENGNPVTEASTSVILARINPILYRSYYYDKETEWYYLTSRFYNPEFCRFINSDNYALPTATPTELTDKNLFAYCDNNPITRYDDNGDFWHIVIGAAVGGIIGGIAEATDEDSNAKTIAISAIAGALSGGLACTGLGVGALVASNIAISAVESFSNQSIKNGVENVDYKEVAADGAIGGVFAAIGGKGGGTKHLSTSGRQTSKRVINKYANKGFRSALKEFKKATKYYFKSHRKYYGKYLKGLVVDVGSFVFTTSKNIKARLRRQSR